MKLADTTAIPRLTSRDIAYEHGWDDGRTIWRRIALGAVAVAVLSLLVATVVLIRWVEWMSQ